ncbi:hypothetical protein DsansV1_C08g0084821 [Dioscorea sansibarensis]
MTFRLNEKMRECIFLSCEATWMDNGCKTVSLGANHTSSSKTKKQ